MNFNVYGCAIHSLSGLNALTTVGKDLTITYNTNMTSLNGLNALTSVGGNLEIADYNTWAGNELHDLSGLDNLVTVGKTLTLAADTYSLHLGKLKSVGKVVLINEYITNLEELYNS